MLYTATGHPLGGAQEVDTSLSGVRVVRLLEQTARKHGLPELIQVDNGPEFRSKALDLWAYQNKVKLDLIEPGKPTQNGQIESFNGRFRAECLVLGSGVVWLVASSARDD